MTIRHNAPAGVFNIDIDSFEISESNIRRGHQGLGRLLCIISRYEKAVNRAFFNISAYNTVYCYQGRG